MLLRVYGDQLIVLIQRDVALCSFFYEPDVLKER